MAQSDAVRSTTYPGRFGQAWLAERGDQEAIRVRYPWGFGGPLIEAHHDVQSTLPMGDASEIASLVGRPSVEANLASQDEDPIEFTFSADWDV